MNKSSFLRINNCKELIDKIDKKFPIILKMKYVRNFL